MVVCSPAAVVMPTAHALGCISVFLCKVAGHQVEPVCISDCKVLEMGRHRFITAHQASTGLHSAITLVLLRSNLKIVLNCS